MSYSGTKFDRFILPGIFIGIILGIYCGWYFGPKMLVIEFIGDMFLNALKAVVIPLIMASMIVGVTGLGDIRRLGSMGGITIVYYIITTSIAVTLGLMVTNFFEPGVGVSLTEAQTPDLVRGKEEFSFIDLIKGMIPTSFFGSLAQNDVLPIIVCTLFFGAILTTLGKEGKPLVDLFKSLDMAMMKIVHILMILAPIGIFALVASILGEKGGGDAVWTEIMKIGKFVITVISGLAIHGIIILPIILFFFGKRNPLEYFKNMLGAITTAFSTDSSAATLPVTMDCVEHKNKISSQTTSFVLPIGATVNMDGTALYEAAAVLFIAQAYGVDLQLSQQFIVFITATLASVGAAAIPHAGLFTMVIVLQAVELPLEGIGLVYTVDWFLDRCRTSVNVWGDSVGAAVVDKTVGGADSNYAGQKGNP